MLPSVPQIVKESYVIKDAYDNCYLRITEPRPKKFMLILSDIIEVAWFLKEKKKKRGKMK